ncbi:MAG: hypothetical protein ACREOW_06240 [Thermodesulfobacteriota bacterium]
MGFIKELFVFSIFSLILISTEAIAVEGNAPNNGWDYEGQLIVINASTGSMVQYCGFSLMEYNAEVIKPSGMGFGFITLAFAVDSNVQAGMHFKVVSQNECPVDPNRLILVLEQIDMMD